MLQPELVLEARADLGEGPAWDALAGRLYWVDLRVGDLHTFEPGAGSDHCLPLGEALGCVAPCRPDWKDPGGRRGDLILGMRSGLFLLDQANGERSCLVRPETRLPGNRFNDGKCDPTGRFLAGTMDDAEVEASGSLYSYAPSGELKRLLGGVRISNGLTWSADGRTLYYIDTPTRQVRAFDYDLSTGDLARPRPVVTVPAEIGWPDGMTADTEGMLWVAMWGGARLTRWDPSSGELLESIPFPALNVSACAFGGQELSDLYVTSARKGMTPEQLERYPLSGGLFRVRTGIRGLPTYRFGT